LIGVSGRPRIISDELKSKMVEKIKSKASHWRPKHFGIHSDWTEVRADMLAVSVAIMSQPQLGKVQSNDWKRILWCQAQVSSRLRHVLELFSKFMNGAKLSKMRRITMKSRAWRGTE
jgi:hypothetical protein